MLGPVVGKILADLAAYARGREVVFFSFFGNIFWIIDIFCAVKIY